MGFEHGLVVGVLSSAIFAVGVIILRSWLQERQETRERQERVLAGKFFDLRETVESNNRDKQAQFDALAKHFGFHLAYRSRNNYEVVTKPQEKAS